MDSYNNVVNAVTKVSKATISDKPDPVTGATVVPAGLTGDSLPRSILAAMRNELVSPSALSGITVLAQLGITTNQSNGTLSFDDNQFSAALSDKGLAGQIQKLFSGDDMSTGLLAKMNAALTPYSQTGGMFDTRETSLNKQQRDLDRQQLNLDLHVSGLTKTLTAKYNAMDSLVAQLKASALNVTSFFDSLNAQNRG